MGEKIEKSQKSSNGKVKDDENDETIHGRPEKGKRKKKTNRNPHLESTNHQEDHENRAAASMEMKMRKKKALLKLRCMVEDAIRENYLVEGPKKYFVRKEIRKAREQEKDISLWGVPLLPSKGHEGTDVVLLKFLTAKDFRVHEAFDMLSKTMKWRKDYKTDTILEENLVLDLEKVVYINSVDKQGQPLYYVVHGAFKDKEFYNNVLGTEENREKFLRWRIQLMEKSIKQLSFKDGGADSILQITDLKNLPGPEMKELRSVSKQSFMLLEANYPEIIKKHILINVPFWYYTSHMVASKLLSKRTKKKFILARPSKVSQTLLKYISPENLPAEYGGLQRDNDVEFFPDDKASELIVRPNSVGCISIPVAEAGVTIVWDLTVVGWDVIFKEEFIPDDEGSYEVLLRKDKEKTMGESVRNSFHISEPGKILITIDNATMKKKRVHYRFKAKPTVVPPVSSLRNRAFN